MGRQLRSSPNFKFPFNYVQIKIFLVKDYLLNFLNSYLSSPVLYMYSYFDKHPIQIALCSYKKKGS